jgi:hypothetical protein
MRPPLLDCNECYVWTGDIYVEGVRIVTDDSAMELAAQFEAGTADPTIDVFPDMSLITTNPENVLKWAAIRFLRYSQVKVNVCPAPKEGKNVKPKKSKWGEIRIGTIPREFRLPDGPEEEDY